jgi:sugar lactone lactonase YvrE
MSTGSTFHQQIGHWPPGGVSPAGGLRRRADCIQFLKGIGDSRDVEAKKDGVSLFAFGSLAEEAVKPIIKPYGIASHGGKLYVADTTAAQVLVIDIPNKSFEYLKGNKSIGKLKKPVNLALDQEGNLFVADSERKEVLAYTPGGEFLRALGGGVLMRPTDVAAFGDDVYVTDFKASDVKILNRRTGELVAKIGRDDPENSLALPVTMTVDGKGDIYVTNMASGKVIVMDRDGHTLRTFGKMGKGFGQFARPRDLTVDKDGQTYVIDAAFQNVQIFNKEGQLLMFFGDPANIAGTLNLPAGIAVSTDNLDYYQKLAEPDFQLESVMFVTSQVGQHKINVYGVGQRRGADYAREYQEIMKEKEEKARKFKEQEEKAAAEKKAKEGESTPEKQGGTGTARQEYQDASIDPLK